jgi:hypothetical protein
VEGLACTTGVRDTPGREKEGGGFMMGNGCDIFFVEEDEEEKDLRMGQKRKRWECKGKVDWPRPRSVSGGGGGGWCAIDQGEEEEEEEEE